MRRLRAIAAAAALAAAGLAQAQEAGEAARKAFDRDFCSGLKRLVRAAPDFEGIWNARPAPPWLGFRPGACRPSGSAPGARAWHCHQQLAPAHLGFESLAAATAACLPQAKRLPQEGYFTRSAAFALPGLTLRMSETGGPGAKVGLISTYAVEERVEGAPD